MAVRASPSRPSKRLGVVSDSVALHEVNCCATPVGFDHVIDRTNSASLKWDHYRPEAIPLWVADMDFACAPAIVEAVRARARHGVYGYAYATDDLVAAVVSWLERRYDWRIEAEWLVWLPSVVSGLNLSCSTSARDASEILTITPVYPPFLSAPGNRGHRLHAVPAEFVDGRWALPLDALERAVTPSTSVLLFCHPHNPLGRCWHESEVAAIVDLCRRHNLVLCSDEIHCDLLLDAVKHTPAVLAGEGAEDLCITLMSPSKAFNMPGLNFAFAVIPNTELRSRFVAAGRGLLPLPGCMAIAAAEAAYRHGEPWLAELLDYLRANRDTVEHFVASELPQVNMTHVEATYLAWLNTSGAGVQDVWQACLDAGVALSPGAIFGDPAYLRLNFACPRTTLEGGLRRLRTAIVG